MKKTITRTLLGSALLLCLLLIGCAGGGGESDSTARTGPPECFQNCLPGAGDVRQAPTEVFIAAGQSNMYGVGDSTTIDCDALGIPGCVIPNFLIWMRDHWETYKLNPVRFGPDFYIALGWHRDHPNDVIGIVEVVIGSTTMGDWVPSWTKDGAFNKGYGPLYSYLWNTYIRAGSLPIKAVFWMQGETDQAVTAINTTGSDAYYASRFHELILTLKQNSNQAPFIFAYTGNVGPGYPLVNAGQVQASMLPGVYAVKACANTTDGTHCDTPSTITTGDDMYQTYKAI